MSITRKSLADTIDAFDDEIAALQESKRETYAEYRADLAERMDKDEVRAEIEATKAAIKRRRAVREKGEETVEHKDALTDEIFAEITTGTRNANARVARGARDDREQRHRQRLSESMDDHKSLVDEMADAGLISEEAREENKRLADAVANKLGAGAINPGPVPDHDPETGEIIEPATHAADDGEEGTGVALLAGTQSTAARKDVHGLSLQTSGSSPVRRVTEPGSQHAGHNREAIPTAGTQAPPVDTHSSALTQALDDEASNPGLTGGEGAQPAVPANSIPVVPGGKHIPHHGTVRA